MCIYIYILLCIYNSVILEVIKLRTQRSQKHHNVLFRHMTTISVFYITYFHLVFNFIRRKYCIYVYPPTCLCTDQLRLSKRQQSVLVKSVILVFILYYIWAKKWTNGKYNEKCVVQYCPLPMWIYLQNDAAFRDRISDKSENFINNVVQYYTWVFV